MLRKRYNVLIILMLLAATVIVVPAVFAALKDPLETREFDNGFSVSGDFLLLFDALGGMAQLGYPITRPFEQGDIMVQYFQGGRMELHHTAAGPVVRLGKLGVDVNPQRTPVYKAENHPRIVYYEGSEYPVSYYFLDFFEYYGGVAQFGLPLTGIIRTADGKLVQYFENVKIEYDTTDPAARVRLAHLGEAFVEEHRDLFPQTAFYDWGYATVNDLHGIVIFLDAHEVYDTVNAQQVDMIVESGRGIPLGNIEVEFWLTDAQDDEIAGSRQMLTLNEEGMLSHKFDLARVEDHDMVTIHVKAEFGGFEATESLLFKVFEH